MSKKEFKAVIFDMDGVIVNSEIAYFQQNVGHFKELGKELTWEQYVPQIGHNHDETWLYFRDLAKSDLSVEEFYKQNHEYCLKHPVDYRPILNPDFHRTYNAIRDKGLKVALASASKEYVVNSMIEQNQLTDFFDVVYSGDMVVNSKPDPEIYLKTAASLEVDPSECIVMEDSSFGVQAAKDAGMTVLGLKNALYSVDLSKSDQVVDKMSHLINWIK